MPHPDILVIGGGVIGCSIAYHLAALGAGRITLLERRQVAGGTSSQSSGILRTHYSVPENVELARRSWAVFDDFAAYLDDPEASAGLVRCGYLIAAPEGPARDALAASLAHQRAAGIDAREVDARQAAELLPIARFDDAAMIGFEPQAGFADAHLVATAFARAARRRGVRLMEGLEAAGLRIEGGRVTGVATRQADASGAPSGFMAAGLVISAQNIWSVALREWAGIEVPVVAERHRVLALQADAAYTTAMPVFKDLASPGMLYARSYGGRQMLVSEGLPGKALDTPDDTQGDIDIDFVAAIGEQVTQRFPGYAEAGLASAWTGVYDVTPDWNPILGPAPGLPGLIVAHGFSGHGFKLSPAVGRVLAQAALGQPTDVPLTPYAPDRFASGRLLTGRYGLGAVS
jgi:sarcosine oxidase subunit beta